ncbi:hypothetical protein ACQJBY_064644 [Aegilops geniculata]
MSRFTSIRSRSHKLHICSFFLLLVFLAGLFGSSAFATRICMGDETNPPARPSVVVEAPMNKQNIFEGKRYEVLNLGGSIDKESDVGKKLLDIKAKGSQLLLEISECKQTLEQESNITASFPAAVQEMDKKSLEEEYKALQGDGAGEAEYFQSLEERIIKMKGVSDPIKCCCGLEYNVELGGESMGVR